ncbi:PIN domain-containing protein [Hymenobacter baengnokdamensis]|uniref:PIN domain-containing protein n=1 Tax=Hymenobacter baengnokdamensis TaxID=2615203 RepID=UPI001245AC84|nr:PIN domain-containing protein [Hymenobacter baengnokdamensis]
MFLDTNLIIQHIRREETLPARTLLSVIVAGELEAFALKAAWGPQKTNFLQQIRQQFPPIEVSDQLLQPYAYLDAYSQGKLTQQPLPVGTSSRNMGKNDLWIAATALYFGVELHTTDHDFDHLWAVGLQVIKP